MCRLGRINLKWLTSVMTQVRGRKFFDTQNRVKSCMLSQSFHFLNINRMHNAWNDNCIVTSTYIVFITHSSFFLITQILGCLSILRKIIWSSFWLQQQNSSCYWEPCFIIKIFLHGLFLLGGFVNFLTFSKKCGDGTLKYRLYQVHCCAVCCLCEQRNMHNYKHYDWHIHHAALLT